MGSYSEKLKDPRWQKVRLKVMERDEFKCKLCQDEGTTLNVHHEEYNGDPWETPIEKLHTYCVDYHTAVELWKDNFKNTKPLKSIKIAFSDKDCIAVIIKTNEGLILSNATEKLHIISITNRSIENLYKLSKEEVNG